MPLSGLNSEQKVAATAPSGYNLIIASAGTGKTSTIVGRIAYLLKQGVPAEKILLLTFTNKASGEMIQRLKQYFPSSSVDKIEAGTFHAVSYRWLKERLPNSTLKQPSELKTLFRSIYEKRDLKRLGYGSEAFSATYLYELYGLYQNATLESFDKWFLERYPEHESLIDIYMDICQEYEASKEEYGFLSFNDLLLKVKERLENREKIPFEEVLVDEYQDTNTLQGAFIDSLKAKSLFCVGDYDQSIYAFNGANIENIATFTERYPNSKVFTLKTNYRSGSAILSLANRVIERNERIYPKELIVGRDGISYSPKLLIYKELFEQYQAIASLISKSKIDYKDIAIIFRNNASADGIEASLRERRIPCRRKGGTSFFDTKEVKFLLDFCTLLINPRDMMASIHIFEYSKGIGTALAKDIFQCLIHFGEGNLHRGLLNPTITTLPKLNPNKNTQLGLFDDDIEIGSVSRFSHIDMEEEIRSHPILKHPRITQDGVRFFINFYRLYKSIQRFQRPSSILKKIISSKLYQEIVESLSNQRSRLKSGEIDQHRKMESRDRILRKARLLNDLATPYQDLHRFVNAMILGGGEMSEGEGVNLLTVHASKGLEFKEVYVIDLMDGRFPNRKLMERTGSLEEERRLFYVAVTRARDYLYLSMAKYDRVKKIDFKPSPFLQEAKMIYK